MGIAMRKIGQTRSVQKEHDIQADTRDETRPRGVRGATITSWEAAPEIDLTSLFARHKAGASLGGSARGGESRDAMELSDGTEISFATPADFKKVLSS